MSIKVSADAPKAKLTGRVSGGGGKHLFATFTKNENGTYSCDCTYEQVCDALELGYDVIAVCGANYGNLVYNDPYGKGLIWAGVTPDPIQFGSGAYQMYVTYFMLAKDGLATGITSIVGTDECYLLPPVDADDEDKIMMVNGGAWNMVPMPKAEMDAEQLGEAVNAALAEAKASGDFKGDKGEKGDPYTLTESDKNTIASAVKASMNTEEWVFTMDDGTSVTKKVFVDV